MIGVGASSHARLDRSQVGQLSSTDATRAGSPEIARQDPQSTERTFALRGEVLGRDALPALQSTWQSLCERAAEDNVYYSRRYAQALLDSVEKHNPVRFAVVWAGDQLVGFLPFTTSNLRIPVVQPIGRAWKSKYTFSCMPLLDDFIKVQVAECLLDVLASVGKGEWIIPTINKDGEACQALLRALERRGLPWVFLDQFSRSILDSGITFEAHIKRHVSSNRRKGLARNRRRLEELGDVEHKYYYFGNGLEEAVLAFLRIEAGGWKGKAGSALACTAATREFVLRAFTGGDGESICRADVLTLDGVPVAVSLIVLAGNTGFAVKSCYDESYRSFSPGIILEVEIVRSFLSGNWARRLDGAHLGPHILDGLWSGQLGVVDLMFSLSPHCAAMRLSACQTTSQAKQKVRAGLKTIMQSLGKLRV